MSNALLQIAHDHGGDVVYLTRLQWDIDRVARDYPDMMLSATKEMMVYDGACGLLPPLE